MNRAIDPDLAHGLAFAILACSVAPAVLLDDDFAIIAASTSFYRSFLPGVGSVSGCSLFKLGHGAWNVPQLRAMLNAVRCGDGNSHACEIELNTDLERRRLVLNAQLLSQTDIDEARLLLTVTDVTKARISEKLKDDLLRDQALLLQEIQHRVANSLQIIAGILMRSARQAHSDETRGDLIDAHNRVMSIATLQQRLAISGTGEVELDGYLRQICQSLGASMVQDPNRVSISVVTDGSCVDAHKSVSLGLIVTELVINALKHAFPDERCGHIQVEYHSHGTDWALTVSDDGIGAAASSDCAEPGLGTSIVKALAHKLGAAVRSEDGSAGTKVTVTHEVAVAALAELRTQCANGHHCTAMPQGQP